MKKFLLIILYISTLNLCAQTYCVFSSVHNFHNGFCVVSNGEKYGVINKKGDLIIPFEYDKIEDCSEGLFSVCKNHKCGYVDTMGQCIIPMMYDICHSFSEGKAVVEVYGNNIFSDDDEKNGVINKKGEFVVPFDNFYRIGSYKNGLARAIKHGKGPVYINEKGEDIIIPFPEHYKLSNFTTTDNSISTPPIIAFPYADSYMQKPEDSVFVYNKNGYVKKEKFYANYMGSSWTEGKLPLCKVTDKGRIVNGYIDTTFKYKDLNVLLLGLIKDGQCVFYDTTNKQGIIDINGNIVIPPIYNQVGLICREKELYAAKKNKWGVINKNGNVVIDFVYDEMMNVLGKIDVYVVSKDGKFGLIDLSGVKIADYVYDKIYNTGIDNRLVVYENGKAGVINGNGDVIISLQYEYVGNFSEEYFTVRKNGLFGFVDANGVPLIIKVPK